MSYIPSICPDCGARLDPGERCDCADALAAYLNEEIEEVADG